MKITRENFKNIVRETMIEENEYQEFFKKALEKTGKSIPDMSDEEKKAFFNKIDSAWKGKGEKNEELVGNQKKLDVDGDGEIEASDLAALRAGKKKNERFGRGPGVGPTFGSANESVNEDFKAVVGKKVYSDGKGKLFFGYEKEDDSVHLVDYKTWKTLTAKNLSNEFMANRLINAIVKGQKQFNKKVEYNMWSNKTKPSFEQRMDYFMKNGWISNINKGGIKESIDVLSVNEAALKQGTMLRYDKNNFVVDYVVDKKYTGKDGFDKYILKVVKSNFPNKIKVGSTEEYEDSKLTGLIRNKVMNFIKNESVNEIQYKDAVAKFNDELIKHPMVKKAAQHYKKTPAEIVKVLQQRLSTKGNRGGDTKEVSIDFKDTNSGITIKHKKSFNESVNEGISVSDERHFGKRGIIIMIDDNGKKVSAIFKDKKNADKYNRNNPSDIKKLLDLAKKTKYPNAIDESVNEAFKHIISVDTPTQIVSKPVAAQIMALAKKGVRSKDIGLKMGFVGNTKLATDTFQKVKNRIYFDLDKKESVNEASIDIKVGDMVKVDNPHWEGALGKKGPFRRKVKAIYDDNVFFTDGSNSSMKYIKK